jgi:putative flippase GtrA
VVIKNKSQKARFGLVGVINTAIDFGVLFALTSIGLSSIIANVVSTSAAFSFSFVANKKVTFRTKGQDIKREIVLFLVVTLFGLWVLQSIIIIGTQFTLSTLHLPDNIVLLIGKIVASCVTLVWNYVLYSRVVFKTNGEHRV